ncbi:MULTISPECIES: hypothetical protein [Photorhabdus]|uniref:Uncharacterized protein n=1 Tax=Photorhabdus kayaii TaxID=230088 RepID=A0ABX0B476_9GAMM|nr:MULTISPECIES: hypothetical protein [Photorhabdus]KTL63155.1 hypothetical protein AA106_18010 [Photorhabdus laumondii subsp. laumondii]MCC8372722.1 hypothetical protein [Photorhabdus bodei]MCT8351279.1 hypothetical protein [Photorhabdus kayaii]MDB6366821.1 hypothetical protein [Photorhabdus bodei]NDL13527.1 hypothetical protein [Photorhabdus kayaii]
MQVHEQPQTAPMLALAGDAGTEKRMQNHAPDGYMVFFIKNSRIFGDLFAHYCAASSARRRV